MLHNIRINENKKNRRTSIIIVLLALSIFSHNLDSIPYTLVQALTYLTFISKKDNSLRRFDVFMIGVLNHFLFKIA